MHTLYSRGLPLAALLVSSLAAGSLIAAPAVSMPAHAAHVLSAAASPVATPAPTAAAPAPVTATVAITPATTNRGGLVLVSGAGFAANETINLAITGTGTLTGTVKADAKGTLTATGVTIPYSLKPGNATLSLTGAISKRSAHTKLTILALTPGITLNATTVSPNNVVTVTGKGFGHQERVTLSLNGAALVTSPTAITTTNGAFTATFKVPSSLLRGLNTISAIGNQSRVSAVATLTGNLPVASTYYFVGGVNSADEHTSVQVLNTNAQPAQVRLTFFFGNGATDTKLVDVAPTSQKQVAVSDLEKFSGDFGLTLTADRVVSAQLVIKRDGKDGDTLLGNTGLGSTWYLAEGYTGLTFKETVAILNPDFNAPAHVLLHLLPFSGRPGKDVPLTVAPHSTYVANINSLMPSQSLSIIASSDRPIVTERTLTFSSDGYGMTTRAGSNTPATSWLFAEGTTVNRFQTFLTILNPNQVASLVTASFFSRDGSSLGSKTILVAARSRANLKLNDFLSASGVATVVSSDLPVVVERPEYFGSPNDAGIAGSDVFGRNGTGVTWNFPAGDTAGIDEYLLVYNPSAKTVPIDATFYTADGKMMMKQVTVPPTVRFNIDVNTLVPGLTGLHGAVLHATNGEGFVAEQTVFAPDHSTLRSTQGLAQ